MGDKPEDDPVYRRMLALYNSIPPGPDKTERFLEKLHGPGWKERAMAVGPLTLQFGQRLLELEARVSRIERHLNQPKLLDWAQRDSVGSPGQKPPRG